MLLCTVFLVLTAYVGSVFGADRGLAWAVDDRLASQISDKPLIKWYYHWAAAPVSQMGHLEYVPMFWGPSKRDQWNQRKAQMNRDTPKHLLAFNEPDIQSQSNISPQDAVNLYMQEIQPWAKKGVKLGSPAIAYNLDWLDQFLKGVKSRRGQVDFINLHWYGSWNDLDKFKQYVQKAHSRFNKNIWVTELGITTASHPNQAQVKRFMEDAIAWLDSQSYVERVAWFGAFKTNAPPDNYATGLNGFFNPNGTLSDLAFWYAYTKDPDHGHGGQGGYSGNGGRGGNGGHDSNSGHGGY